MSALVYPPPEPYKLPAGVLALVVHGAFFSLLYFGLGWQPKSPQGVDGMVVDIWDSLPALQSEPVKVVLPPSAAQMKPPRPAERQKLVEAVRPPRADIELAERKPPKIQPSEPVQPVETKPAEPVKAEPAQTNQMAQVTPTTPVALASQSGQDRAHTMQIASTGKLVDEYKLRIIAKIRRNIVMPPGVRDNMQAEFDVVLVPDGSVQSARLVKPSGSRAYDDAVGRAIRMAQPLPLPPDILLFDRFRELHLIFRPRE